MKSVYRTAGCSNSRLIHNLLVGLLGIEPSPPAPKAGILPVYYSPISLVYPVFLIKTIQSLVKIFAQLVHRAGISV
jgi:hypothetical protein